MSFLFASVAQLVEQWIEDPRVGGSIPSGGTINMDMRVEYRKIEDGRQKILEQLTPRNVNFRVVDVGGTVNGWTEDIVHSIIDIQAGPFDFRCNISNENEWRRILEYVNDNGKFDFCICTHTLEDIANPQLVLRMLPKIAKRGVIAMPSVISELSRVESQGWLGYIHHRHMFDWQYDELVVAPKLNFLESWIGKGFQPTSDEIAIYWEDTIPFRMIMDDYLGPNVDAVLEAYKRFISQAERNFILV